MADIETRPDVTALTVQLLSAYLANNTLASDELASLIRTTRSALTEDLGPAPAETEEAVKPAVTVRKSLASPDYILSLIDGKPYKTLKRHLARHGLTADSYRERYKLPSSYPMIAPSFAAKRREIAENNRLGRSRRSGAGAVQQATAVAAVHSDIAPAKAPPKASRAKTKGPKSVATVSAGSKAAADKVRSSPVPELQSAGDQPTLSNSAAALETGSAAKEPKPGRAAKRNNGDVGAATKRLAPKEKRTSNGDADKSRRPSPFSGKRPTRASTDAETEPKAAEPPRDVKSAGADGTKPARGKLGLFRAKASEKPRDEVTKSGVVSVGAGEARAARQAPRAKRMARTPEPSSSR